MKNKFKRIVVKIGSSSLTYSNGRLNLRRMEKMVRVLADLYNRGVEVVLVTSGAVAVGVGKMGLKKKPDTIPLKQAAAAVGQCELMFVYDKLFSEYNCPVAQVLLTRDVVTEREPLRNVKNTFSELLKHRCIPIVNENDTVAVEEVEALGTVSDNDTLSAIVAKIVEADLLVLLSDVEGLYDCNPKENTGARVISRVEVIDDALRALCGGAGTEQGTGGMITKILAAEVAMEAGISMLLTNSDRPENLYDIFDGLEVGTLFTAKKRK